MHKIISLKKEITFKNTIEEIVSISMDDKLCLEDLLVKGDFVVEGEYLTLSKKEPFHFEIPYLGYLEEHYDSCKATVKVDDFYYEIITLSWSSLPPTAPWLRLVSTCCWPVRLTFLPSWSS